MVKLSLLKLGSFEDIWKYVVAFIVIVLMATLYKSWTASTREREQRKDSALIKDFLVRKSDIDDVTTASEMLETETNEYEREKIANGLPPIWIHSDYSVNSRQWKSFGSRNSTDINQPYLNLTVASIISRTRGTMNVCLIDDESFAKLLPEWTIDIRFIPEPMKSNVRSLALMKLLHRYGGMLIPSGYYAIDSPHTMFAKDIDCFVVETKNTSVTRDMKPLIPNHRFMGCRKGCGVMREIIQQAEMIVSKDSTEETQFWGSLNGYIFKLIDEGKIHFIPGKYVGVTDKYEKIVHLENLFSTSKHIEYPEELQGILIPQDEILKRYKYQWFAALSPQQIMDNDFILAKYLNGERPVFDEKKSTFRKRRTLAQALDYGNKVVCVKSLAQPEQTKCSILD